MITLTMPADIRQYVLELQGKMKASKGLGHYSQQHTILHIIREHKELTDESPKNNPSEQQPKLDSEEI